MAVIQPDEIAGLPELIAEVKALRQELELLKAGVRLAQPERDVPMGALPIAMPAYDSETDETTLQGNTPEEIRERVGRVVGERNDEPTTPRPAHSPEYPEKT